jgi:hypothetical protein
MPGPEFSSGRCDNDLKLMRDVFKSLELNYKGFKKAVKEVSKTNLEVDTNEINTKSAHFDGETFEIGAKRLIAYRQLADYYARSSSYDEARVRFGELLHTHFCLEIKGSISTGNFTLYDILSDDIKTIICQKNIEIYLV